MAEVTAYLGHERKCELFSVNLEGRHKNFQIDVEGIQARAIGSLDEASIDLLEIASIVFAADSTVSRGSAVRAHMGDRWRREFEFSIPVTRTDLWASESMQAALADAVSFLTDDMVRFRFHPRSRPRNRQPYFLSSQTAKPFEAGEVILFSGGLDSFSGALEALASRQERVVLVTHRSSQKALGRQTRLGRHLSRGHHGRVQHARVVATRVGAKASESTQRSRSFLFAALGYAFAQMYGAARVSFYENGVISHNLPISSQVLGTMATRTTHPAALRKIARLFELLAEAAGHPPVAVENPYTWLTKTEVVQRIQKYGGVDMIRHTVSCTVLHKQSLTHTHCGACSQCLDRRFAVMAAGLEDHDPADAYETDVLLGERPHPQSRTMALDWTRSSWGSADASERDFLTNFAGEVVRILAGYPGSSHGETLRKAYELHRRQGEAVRRAIEKALALHAGALLRGELPPDSLLRMFTTEQLTGAPLVGLSEAMPVEVPSPEQPPTAEPEKAVAPAGTIQLFPLQVGFAMTARGPYVHVLNLNSVNGRPAELLHALKAFFDEDRAALRPRDLHRYLRYDAIAVGDQDVTKMLVRRCRQALAKAYEALEGQPPPEPLLVQSKRPGYRLDPDIRIVAETRSLPTRRG